MGCRSIGILTCLEVTAVAYRATAVVTGLRYVVRASEGERERTDCRAWDINWALKTVLEKAERATEGLEVEIARKTERAAAVRHNMMDDCTEIIFREVWEDETESK